MPSLFRSSYGQLLADALLEEDRFASSLPRIRHEGVERPSLAGYPILGRLGQGGGGAVYLGVHVRLERPVAIKIVHETLLARNIGARERFLREARLAAKVASPHIVGILDVDEVNGLPYLVMEYVNGQSAHAHLRARADQGGVPEAEALDICIAATDGLAAAHARDVVHRDVKPDNILIPYAPQAADPKAGASLAFKDAKLTDLGLARFAEHGETLTQSGMALGTPGFMSPEQIRDARTARKPADVFGMGATLYALLAAHAPWHGSTPTDTALKTIEEPPAPLEQFRPDVSEGTRKLIARCLEKDPERRLQDGAELLDALRVCRAALGASRAADAGKKVPPPSPTPRPFLKRVSSNPLLWILVVPGVGVGVWLTLLVLGVGVGVWLTRARGPVLELGERYVEAARGYSFRPPKGWELRSDSVAGSKWGFGSSLSSMKILDGEYSGTLAEFVKERSQVLDQVAGAADKKVTRLDQSELKLDSGEAAVRIIFTVEFPKEGTERNILYLTKAGGKVFTILCISCNCGSEMDGLFEMSAKSLKAE